MNLHDHCLWLTAAIVGDPSRFEALLDRLQGLPMSRMGVRPVALAPVDQGSGLNPAEWPDVAVVPDLNDLAEIEGLDLIVNLTGRADLTARLAAIKPDSVSLVDGQAMELLIQTAALVRRAARTEREVSLAKSMATALLNASPDGVMVINPDYTIDRANNSVLLCEGRGGREAEGSYCFQALHNSISPCAGPERHCPMKEAVETGRTARAVHEMTAKDGESKICHVTCYPIFDLDGQIVQVVDVVRDITADLSKRVEQRTQALKDDLARFVQEDRLISLGRLVASVCHEINNPILSIVTFNKLILKSIKAGELSREDLDQFERHLDLSVREALRCGRIVNNLLSFARQRNIEAKSIDLLEMIDTIIVLTGHQMDMAGIELTVDLPSPPFTAWGDYAQIQQCIMNLIFNALDAMPEGGRLTLTGYRLPEKNEAAVKVIDTGHGIPDDVLPRIFEPFFSTKGEIKGVGLGLSMVYGIISEHHGRIEVDSRVGEGTCFSVILPTTAQPPAGLREATK